MIPPPFLKIRCTPDLEPSPPRIGGEDSFFRPTYLTFPPPPPLRRQKIRPYPFYALSSYGEEQRDGIPPIPRILFLPQIEHPGPRGRDVFLSAIAPTRDALSEELLRPSAREFY